MVDLSQEELKRRADVMTKSPRKKSKAEKQQDLGKAHKLKVIDGGQPVVESTPPVVAKEAKEGKVAKEGKAKRTPSASVLNWKKQGDFKMTQRIVILKPGSKSRQAALRFNEYVDGMTVQEYIDKMNAYKKQKRTAALTMQDLRWDHACGFIAVK